MTRALPEAHFLVDSEGTIIAANRAAETLLGAAPGGLAGRALTSFVEDPPERVAELVASGAASGRLLPGRLRLKEYEGGSVPAGVGVVRPLQPGRPAIVLVRIDATDQGSPFLLLTRKIRELRAEVRRRMALEAERAGLLAAERAAREEAERANRVKDEFLATLSHELRTPLNAILGWAAMLRSGDAGPDRLDQALRTIEQSARAQSQLVGDLLDVSQILAGRLRLDVRALNVGEVVEAALDAVRPTAEMKGVRLQSIVDPRAGPVNGDPDRLRQVVWNLLTNAIKFTPRGGRVEVRVERINSHIEIIVADTGEGIDAEFLPHIFDRFRQADGSHTRAHGGLGLGLSIARHLVEAHAGVLHASSEGRGKGATFTVILPQPVYDRPPVLETGQGHPSADPATAPDDAPPAAHLTGLDILLLEDHDDSRELLIVLLEKRGARVRAAASAEEAREHIRARLPDVVIADIELPGEDGYTFLRKLRDQPPDLGGLLPAIATTAFSRRVDRLRALEAGFHLHLPKPVDPEELVASIRALSRIGVQAVAGRFPGEGEST